MDVKGIRIFYDEDGKAVRVQMEFDIYKWLMDHIPQSEQSFAVAK